MTAVKDHLVIRTGGPKQNASNNNERNLTTNFAPAGNFSTNNLRMSYLNLQRVSVNCDGIGRTTLRIVSSLTIQELWSIGIIAREMSLSLCRGSIRKGQVSHLV